MSAIVNSNDSFANLVRYPQLLASDKLTWKEKCAYIPIASNVKGAVEIIQTVAFSGIFLATAALGVVIAAGIVGLSISAGDPKVLHLMWLNIPFCATVLLMDDGGKLAYNALSKIGKGLVQQVPVLGNAVLASYDIKKYNI